jgi:O-antigen ligase
MSGLILLLDFMRTFRIPRASLFAVLVIGGLAATSLIWPPIGIYGDEKFARLWITLGSAAAAGVLLRPRNVRHFALVWLLAAVALAVTATAGINSGGRAIGLDESNPVWLGRASATGIVILGWLAWTGRLRWTVSLVAMGVLVFGIFQTGSRGPMLAAAVGLLVVVVSWRGHLPYQRAVATVLGLASITLAILYLPGAGRTSGGLLDPAREVSGDYRRLYWEASVNAIASNFGGTGIGGWSSETGVAASYPHNLFLEVFVEAGWVIGVVLCVLVIRVVARLFLHRRDPVVVLTLAILVTELVAVSVSGDMTGRTFWFMLALGWAVGARATDPRRSDEASRLVCATPRSAPSVCTSGRSAGSSADRRTAGSKGALSDS